MSEHNLNGIIDTRAFFERILSERERFEEERQRRLDERFDALDRATKLQAEEYARRLHDLNGEYARDRARQTNYVGMDKFETNLRNEQEKRELALLRVDEKFADYVQRYELRQREVDLLLAAQQGAVDQAARASEEQARKSNRNLAIVGLVLTLIVAAANFIPSIVG